MEVDLSTSTSNCFFPFPRVRCEGRASLGHFQPRGRVGGETSNPGVRRPQELLLKLISVDNGLDWDDGPKSCPRASVVF